tara:strand:- start:1585 stop:2610 length:1026 start_codon:yes stop_codon:yes gene_type:complete
MKNVSIVNKLHKDKLSRSFEYLRISVTDRCNYRCSYCMPSEIFNKNYNYISQDKILSYEEIIRMACILKKIGLKKIRLTGGEPLLRRNIDKLINQLKTKAKIEHVGMTTNGSLLTEEKLQSLKEAGLDSLTLSLDTLKPGKINQINGAKKQFNVDKALKGIEKYFGLIKTNTVVIKGVNDEEIFDIINRVRKFKSEIRFIEYMDVGESHDWNLKKVISTKDLISKIESVFDIYPIETEKSSTSKLWAIKNTDTSIGFISSITEPFCSECNRARLSVDGKLFTCLFATDGYDFKEILRSNLSDDKVLNYFQDIWRNRSDRYSEIRFTKKEDLPKVEMSYIGG